VEYNIFTSIEADTKPLAKKARQSTATSAKPEVLDKDGILIDIDVQSVGDSGSTHEGKTVDIDQFFGNPYKCTGANGKVKKHRKCKICM
jgi:hypothetical protein